ncbi:hypothetical protein REPUB_Repub04eG0246000 [Reevesia pubescens]
MDLRYIIPPAVNLIIFLFVSPLNGNPMVASLLEQKFSILELAFVILAMMFLLLFLFTSVELPLTLNPIRFLTGTFSIALTASLLASLFFPPSLFWSLYFFIIISSPWHDMFFYLFKQFFQWFLRALQLLPTYSITRNIDESSNNPAPPRDNIELGVVHDQAELEA